MNRKKDYDSKPCEMSSGIYCDILQAGHCGYTRAWNRYLPDQHQWGMGRLILYCGWISSCHYSTKTPLFLSLCTYVGCVVSCHDNSPLLPAYLGLALCLLTGARQPRGLHRCSPMTVWWSFIANSSVFKSLLLSSLFWFMYFLIYLCMWTMGREERRG